jgi:hypothetical protein
VRLQTGRYRFQLLPFPLLLSIPDGRRSCGTIFVQVCVLHDRAADRLLLVCDLWPLWAVSQNEELW